MVRSKEESGKGITRKRRSRSCTVSSNHARGKTKKKRKTKNDVLVKRLADGKNLYNEEFTVRANDVITFKLRSSTENWKGCKKDEKLDFHPAFTHQLFHGEQIHGFKNLNINIFCTAGSLYCYLKVNHSERQKNADDLSIIQAQLPRGSMTGSPGQFQKHIGEIWEPPGEKIFTYIIENSRRHSSAQLHQNTKKSPSRRATTYSGLIRHFDVYRGDFQSLPMRKYHERLQLFLLFFIDRSSFINMDDPHWEIILLTERIDNNWIIIGYTTLYKFFCYPDRWKLRISQFLILPPYQRQGHGQRLLRLIYNLAIQRDYVEITVEHPSPKFQYVRDLIDLQKCRSLGFYTSNPPPRNKFDEINKKDLENIPKWNRDWNWDPKYAKCIQKTLKITEAQVHRCYEVLKRASIDPSRSNHHWRYKDFRIEVKRRLSVIFAEELCGYSKKLVDRKKKLHEFYSDLEDCMLMLIKRLGLTCEDGENDYD